MTRGTLARVAVRSSSRVPSTLTRHTSRRETRLESVGAVHEAVDRLQQTISWWATQLIGPRPIVTGSWRPDQGTHRPISRLKPSAQEAADVSVSTGDGDNGLGLPHQSSCRASLAMR